MILRHAGIAGALWCHVLHDAHVVPRYVRGRVHDYVCNACGRTRGLE